jgi:hypothetical protein
VQGRVRGRDAIAVDLVGVVGLTAFLLGLTWLQASDKIGFDPGAALHGVLSQLSATLPAALLVLAASALELAAGVVIARAARRGPFDSLADAFLAAMVAAILKDTLLLGTLAAFGLFLQPILIVMDAALIGAGLWLLASRRWKPPLIDAGSWRRAIGGGTSITIAALVAVVWIGPFLLQLASPVVPFIDVLPNYVGPVEHLRTFGWFSPLDATQSPIIGPSRTVLGYDGLLGALATMTNLSGGTAIAGFILPQTILVATSARRLAGGLAGGDASPGAWALLAFALSQPFARLADARGTVVVVPLVCIGLALAVDSLRQREDPWRIGRGAAIGLAFGAATLVHPVIGFFAIATVAIAGLAHPSRLAPSAFVATVTAGLIALPQAATMAGLALPTLALGVWLPVAVLLGSALGRVVGRRAAIADGLIRLATIGRWVILALVAIGIAAAFAANAFRIDRLSDAWGQGWDLVVESSGLLLVVLVAGIVLGSRGARSALVLAGLLVGIAAVALVAVLPDNLGFLGDALRFEVPKTVFYWLSLIAAAGAAAALGHVWSRDRLSLVARAGALAAFVAVAALPLRADPIDAYHLGEHRWSETFAIDLRFAGSGFWVGFPDTRLVVDAPRQEILEALRAEITAGRLHHDTPVLHVSRTFQQWESTPLGVFDGVFETSISLEPEVSHQTVGGRLFGSADAAEMLDQLRTNLSSGTYPYVVLEPADVPPDARTQIESAGYTVIFENEQGVVFRKGA